MGRGHLFAHLVNIENEDKNSQNQQNEMFIRCALYPIFVLVTNHLTS